MNWQDLHEYYINIKNKYNLTSYDIYRQLGVNPPYSYTQYLHPSGDQRCPSMKPGTVGHKVREILTNGLTKTNWAKSTSSYEEKLHEIGYNHKHIVSVNVLNKTELEIRLCMNEGPMLSKEILEKMFTIDDVTPTILYIDECYYL